MKLAAVRVVIWQFHEVKLEGPCLFSDCRITLPVLDYLLPGFFYLEKTNTYCASFSNSEMNMNLINTPASQDSYQNWEKAIKVIRYEIQIECISLSSECTLCIYVCGYVWVYFISCYMVFNATSLISKGQKPLSFISLCATGARVLCATKHLHELKIYPEGAI